MDRVCVLWVEGKFICSLRHGDGKIRTYRPDNIDPRVGAAVPVEPKQDLWDVLLTGALCTVPVQRAMQEMGWRKRQFADLIRSES